MIPQPQIEAVMDYEQMSKFITWVAFRMLKQPHNPSINFEQLLNLLLYATRLTKTTVLVAIEYLNQRFSHLDVPLMDEGEVFTLLVVSMMLANKSQDDATFTARSWSQASGIRLDMLNEYERKWLEAVKWDLFINKFLENIQILEKCWYTYLQNGYSSANTAAATLTTSANTSPTATTTASHTPTAVPPLATLTTGATAAAVAQQQQQIHHHHHQNSYNCNYNYGYNEPSYSSYSYYQSSYSYYPQSYNYYYSQAAAAPLAPVPPAPPVPSLYYDPVVILVFP
ncbi:PHO85 cyclin CLG1 [Candida viswanathii]|jgi:hypothetical protein|uniref:PHO85 cyclin CLG1 n=1 Tax=Candida viswanathii TaxID=5486 RepID=A0A367Y6E2_9ASCO|nr:PHO85 cyclin CLG1 [Candida viswanathii]